jgi:hypothetical protein|tara:strand:+ start:1325 stop:1477 length:153 start_codon:yes stop_codon:yes gene_type:complete
VENLSEKLEVGVNTINILKIRKQSAENLLRLEGMTLVHVIAAKKIKNVAK